MDSYIPKEKLTAWERWELAAFDELQQQQPATPDTPPEPAPPPVDATPEIPEEAVPIPALPSAEEIERWRTEAQEAGQREGYAAGFEAGRQDGEAASRAEAERLGTLAADFTHTLETLENRLAEDVLALALDVARQVLRTSLEVRHELVMPAVREAMAMLPIQHGHPNLLLHPEDATLVRSHLADQITHSGWRITEDPSLARGSCRIDSSGSNIDATLPTRWRRVVETLGVRTDWFDDKA